MIFSGKNQIFEKEGIDFFSFCLLKVCLLSIKNWKGSEDTVIHKSAKSPKGNKNLTSWPDGKCQRGGGRDLDTFSIPVPFQKPNPRMGLG